MPTKAATTKARPAGKLAGKTVAFVGKFGYGNWDRERLQNHVKFQGGQVVNWERRTPDLVIYGAGVGGRIPGAVAKVQKKHAAVQVLSESDFYDLLTPTADELYAILKKCPHDSDYWQSHSDILEHAKPPVNLSGRDLRGFDLQYASLHPVNFDGCDFRNANLEYATLGTIRDAKFDGATINHLESAQDCSLKNVIMPGAMGDRFLRCDFTGADLSEWFGLDIKVEDCVFRTAKLNRAELLDGVFKNCDFTRAELRDANLESCNLSGANLSHADLSNVDLTKAKLTRANLTGANLTNAILTDAVLTGARLDGADFRGAALAGANLKGASIAKARNLDVRPARTPGPHLRKLVRVVRKSKTFLTTIELEPGKGESVVLEPRKYDSGKRGFFVPRYDHVVPDGRRAVDSYLEASSFEEAMLLLTDRWGRGTPKFETIAIKATRCPVKGEELQNIVLAAWCEVLGVPVPGSDELQSEQQKLATARESFRETLLAELRGGAKGIALWNKRPQKDRDRIGSLREADFTKLAMRGVQFHGLDFRGAKFDGTTLAKANIWNCQFQGASFATARLDGVTSYSTKFQNANFEHASLVGCELSALSFRDVNFRNANLTRTHFYGADLCGADLTGATLEKNTWAGTKFDHNTKLTAGFTPPKEMVWKGTGSRPGLRAVKTVAPGSMDFPTFLKNLEKSVEAAKFAKATSMLKAERFQLFADVTDDAVTGVVRSQSADDLVYACRLVSDGSYGCGTQNLRYCGGLLGSPCKHLLVLVVGLAKAGKIDPATAYGWMAATRSHQPTLDKDHASETFLKYKGAEAGEIDWRPTETVPEDFYST
jgi:uncharacterized protein YjbI with pentapeptide repeats